MPEAPPGKPGAVVGEETLAVSWAATPVTVAELCPAARVSVCGASV